MSEITKDTPLKDFPSIYNADRKELIDRIEELEKSNAQIKVEYENKIKELTTLFNRLSTKLMNDIGKKLDELEDRK